MVTTKTAATATPFWWPLDLTQREDQALKEFRRQMIDTPVTLKTAPLHAVSELLTELMRQNIASIIERDSLPHLSHVLNGWGDVKFQDVRLMQRLDSFIHLDRRGHYFIHQCDPEGEFHPWQSIAYAIMAGTDPDAPMSFGVSLRALAQNSRYLRTREGRELGHLLFSLAYLDPNIEGEPFSLLGENCDFRRLMELAVEAHHYGSFEVCRKFHLTEGLCAMAAKVEGLEDFRDDAQGFLEGQLDMLLLLGVILSEARRLASTQSQAEEGSLIEELRDTLVMGKYLENHCYYAGHLIELAAFAESLGYHLSTEHRSAMAFVVNELNETLPAFLPFAYFPECFLHLGHYRRAMTLLAEMERLRDEKLPLSSQDLALFTVDLDQRLPRAEAELSTYASQPSPVARGIYDLAVFSESPRARFVEIINHYRSTAAPGFEPRGNAEHFRRLIPPHWPRALHYEFLDYGATVGAELHLESDEVVGVRDQARLLQERVRNAFPGRQVDWDPEWESVGRLRVLFDPETSTETVATGMSTLLDVTYHEMESALQSARNARA
jgi:hypothetical protein